MGGWSCCRAQAVQAGFVLESERRAWRAQNVGLSTPWLSAAQNQGGRQASSLGSQQIWGAILRPYPAGCRSPSGRWSWVLLPAGAALDQAVVAEEGATGQGLGDTGASYSFLLGSESQWGCGLTSCCRRNRGRGPEKELGRWPCRSGEDRAGDDCEWHSDSGPILSLRIHV